jgi:hypothetical protein
MDNLRKAHMGNYGLMLSLLGFLEGGLHVKKLTDRVIDSCEFMRRSTLKLSADLDLVGVR